MRPGYKLTEVGLIPENWKVCQFAEVTDLITCGIAATPSYVSEAQGFPFLSSTNVKNGKIDWRDFKYINSDLHKQLYRNNPPQKRDILYSRVGTIGEAAVVEVDFEFSIYVSLTLIKPKKNLNSYFLMQLLNSLPYKSRAREQVYLGGGVGNLNVDVVRRYPIPLPGLEEQKAIALALSDMDALISGLDQLIAKKRGIKQAAMQQLLSGKQRLPGFSGGWEVKQLGDVLRVRHGKSQSSIEISDGKYPILATGGEIGRTNTFLYDKPSVLIGRKGTIDRPIYRDEPFWTVDTLFYTEIAKEAVPVFIYYKFLMIDWRSYNETSGVPSLNASTIEAIDIVIPDIAEQTAIAAILSDMDSELTALETRHDKARQLKQGMMQELLTGRIRLL